MDTMVVTERVSLPGCGHTYHCACVLTYAQYDTKCPTCRQQPSGVTQRARTTTTRRGVEELLDDDYVNNADGVEMTEDEMRAVRASIDSMRAEWERYERRRQRCIRADARMSDMRDRLRALRSDMRTNARSTDALFKRKCKLLWRNDDELGELKREFARKRRRELRIERALEEAVEAAVGPKPAVIYEEGEDDDDDEYYDDDFYE